MGILDAKCASPEQKKRNNFVMERMLHSTAFSAKVLSKALYFHVTYAAISQSKTWSVAPLHTGYVMHRMCRTYTTPELLQARGHNPSKEQRIKLGRAVMSTVVALNNSTVRERPRRVVFNRSGSEAYWAKLYHRNEVDQVQRIIDHHASAWRAQPTRYITNVSPDRGLSNQKDQECPVLGSAFFHPQDRDGECDVTRRLEAITREEGGDKLVLAPPPPLRDGLGRMNHTLARA